MSIGSAGEILIILISAEEIAGHVLWHDILFVEKLVDLKECNSMYIIDLINGIDYVKESY